MFNLEAEYKVLHSICCFADCLNDGMLKVKTEYFSEQMNRRIFETIKVMYSAEKTITLMTVYEEMKNILSKNHTRWMVIDQLFCSSSEFEYLVQKLEECNKKRKINNLALMISNGIVDGIEIDKLIKTAQDEIYKLEISSEEVKIISPFERANSILETISERMEKKSSGGITTSYPKLNRAINGGFKTSELVIVAAKTGKGKTAFAMNLARDISMLEGGHYGYKYPCLYINTEMNEEQWDTRMATILTSKHKTINHYKIATGNLDNNEYNEIVKSLDVMSSSQFYNVTIPDLDVDKVISITNRFKAQKEIKVMILDYVGRLSTTDKKLQEWQVLRDISKRMKTLAQKLNIVVIMLAQLNDDDKLEGAKAMKNECDLALFLQEMSESNKEDHNDKFNYFLNIEKNRNGPTGTLLMKFTGDNMLFEGEMI